MVKQLLVTTLIASTLCAFTPQQQPAIKVSMDRGEKVYKSVCMACHQPDGDGVQRMNPTLINTKWVLGDKKALAKIVLEGLKGGEIEIDGDDFHNPMPPQKSQLSDQQIADVLTFVRNSFGNKASAVSVKDVQIARGGVKPGAQPTTVKKIAPAKKPAVKH